jgi:carbon storage regulator
MLVIARKRGQSIILRQDGKPDINLHIVSNDRGIIRVGIDAPKDVVVLREELLDRGVRRE